MAKSMWTPLSTYFVYLCFGAVRSRDLTVVLLRDNGNAVHSDVWTMISWKIEECSRIL